MTQLSVRTGSSFGSGSYADINAHLGSHGFLATCYNSPNTGSGDLDIKAFQTAYSHYPELAHNKIGSLGHSQGDQGSFVVLQHAEGKWGDSYRYTGLCSCPCSIAAPRSPASCR